MKVMRMLGAAIASLLLVLTSSPAYAGTRIRGDAVGDVAAHVCTGDVWHCTWSPAPRRANGDIIRNTVNHTSRRLWVRTKFRSLDKLRGELGYKVRVVSSDGQWRDIIGGWGDPAGGAVNDGAFMVHPDGDEDYCAGLTQRIDWERNYIELSMPRSCIRNPSWVRVGARMSVSLNPPGAPSTWPATSTLTSYVDQAYLDAPMSRMAWTLSGRVHRG